MYWKNNRRTFVFFGAFIAVCIVGYVLFMYPFRTTEVPVLPENPLFRNFLLKNESPISSHT
jgi:hypothetical protein